MSAEQLPLFEEMCREEYPRIVRMAYGITGDREEALDIAQTAFARAYERWDRVSRLDRPGAWLNRVAANEALSWRRRQRSRLTRLVPGSSHDAVPGPEETLHTINPALLELSREQRAVVVLRYYADLSVDEVAGILKKRPGTVRALTAQALARLRKRVHVEEDRNGDR